MLDMSALIIAGVSAGEEDDVRTIAILRHYPQIGKQLGTRVKFYDRDIRAIRNPL
jgi:hypothetical protein